MKVCNDVCGVVYIPDPVEGEFRFVLRSPWMNNFPGPLTATFEPTQDLVGISDRCRESDTLKITPRKPGQSFEYRGQVRAAVVIGERMDFVDDDSLQPRKELPRRNSGAHEHGFDGLWCRQQNVGRFAQEPRARALADVTVPFEGATSEEPCIMLDAASWLLRSALIGDR